MEVAGEAESREDSDKIMHVGGESQFKGLHGAAAPVPSWEDAFMAKTRSMRQWKDEGSQGLIVGSSCTCVTRGAVTSFWTGSSIQAAHMPPINRRRRLHPPAGQAPATLDQLNKYFMISQMPVVSSEMLRNIVHGMSGRCEKG